jgi:cell division protein FtsI/penicillin-binding protein 2
MFSRQRLLILSVIITILFAASALRAVQVQVVDAANLTNVARDQQVRRVVSTAPRGTIYDRNGNVLAVSTRAFAIYINPRVVTDTLSVANAIGPALDLPTDSLRQRMDAIIADSKNVTRTIPNILAYGVSPTRIQGFRDAVRTGRLGHAMWEEETWPRTYPFGDIGGPTVGFVSLYGDTYSGVEAFANGDLAEQRGERKERTRMDLLENIPAHNGADLVLSLDMNLQAFVERRLAEGIRQTGARRGSVIVMETASGRVLASASSPGYDPNKVMELAQTAEGAGRLRDAAVSDLYEPGSVIKVCTIAAALDAGVITPDSVYFDSGIIEVEGKPIRNSDRGSNGRVDITNVLAKSINVVTVQIAQDMGADQMYRAFQAFGLGRRSGIDVGGESNGLLRTPGDEQWSRVDLATNSYGQGMQATPYQVINAVNAIANDGILMQPYVIQEARAADGTRIQRQPVAVQRAISADSARQMRRMMAQATELVTPEAAPKGYTVAGKTGTADWYLRGLKQETTLVTYVGFLPAEKPQLTILVKLDEPRTSRWAKETTVPIFHDVAEHAVRLLGIPPDVIDRRQR